MARLFDSLVVVIAVALYAAAWACLIAGAYAAALCAIAVAALFWFTRFSDGWHFVAEDDDPDPANLPAAAGVRGTPCRSN